MENFETMESYEFNDDELEVQELLEAAEDNEPTGEVSEDANKIELSQEIRELSVNELRELSSSEYAEHGETPLREAYLRLIEEKEDANKNRMEISFGSGTYHGKTAEEWLAEEKIAKIEGRNSDIYRKNAKKAAKNDL